MSARNSFMRSSHLKRTAGLALGFLVLCLISFGVGPYRAALGGTPPRGSHVQPDEAHSGKKPLTLHEVVDGTCVGASPVTALSWRPGGKQLSYVRPASAASGVSVRLCAYDLESHKETLLFTAAGRKEKLDLNSYQWSPRGDLLLLEGENNLWLLDPHSGDLRQLTSDRDEKEVPTFSPTGDRIAFVMKHDLCVVEVKSGTVRQLTHDGSDSVYNGRQDWVYEEELANRSTARAYEWSPDGKHIAYLRLDDGPVPEYPITDYIATHVALIRERFPQAGDPNPVPSLHVVAVDNASAQASNLTVDPKQTEYIGPSFTWTPDGSAVCFLALNRAQTDEAVHRWEPQTGNDRVLFVEHDPYWVNSLEPPRFLPDGREFFWISERDGWQHVYLYAADGKLERQITRGAWMVDRPIFQDAPLFQPAENWLYFASTYPDPRERQLYRIHLDGTGMQRLTTEPGSHTLNLSPGGRYLVDGFSTPDAPPATRLLKSDGTFMATIDAPANHLAEFALGKREYVELKAADGQTLYAQLLKPANFDPHKKYPVIVDVYGGPHVQLVQKRWDANSFTSNSSRITDFWCGRWTITAHGGAATRGNPSFSKAWASTNWRTNWWA